MDIFKDKKSSYRWDSRQYWLSVTFKVTKVDDIHFTWKGVCHFLLVIDSNLGRISHRFLDMTHGQYSVGKRTFFTAVQQPI